MKENNRRSSTERFPRRDTARGKSPSGAPEAETTGKKQRQPFGGEKQLYEVIKVRFVHSKRLAEVNANDKKLMPDTPVLVKVGRNLLLATTIGHRYRTLVEANSLPFVVRIASQSDVATDSENVAIEARAQKISTMYALDKNLQMKVISADLSHDRKNITINFASDVRVDFREMVAFLSSELKLRVEMFQLGLRSGTGLLCGLGSCGQSLCCGRFLGQFEPVAVKLLRAQGLATNPKRISGVCGRLYCCLSYEYGDFLKEGRPLPKKGRKLLTRLGIGRVIDNDPIREEVVVVYENGESQRLSHSDFVVATEEILGKAEAGGFEFPLENARFYLNNDPSTAVDMGHRLKANPLANNPNARSGQGRTNKAQNTRNPGVLRKPKPGPELVAEPLAKRKDLPIAVEGASTEASQKKRPPRTRRNPRPLGENEPVQTQVQTDGRPRQPRPPRRRPLSPNRDVNSDGTKTAESRATESHTPAVQQDGAASVLIPRTEQSDDQASRRVRRTQQSKTGERIGAPLRNEQRSLAKPDLSTATRPQREVKPDNRDQNTAQTESSREGATPREGAAPREGAPRRRRRRRPSGDAPAAQNPQSPPKI